MVHARCCTLFETQTNSCSHSHSQHTLDWLKLLQSDSSGILLVLEIPDLWSLDEALHSRSACQFSQRAIPVQKCQKSHTQPGRIHSSRTWGPADRNFPDQLFSLKILILAPKRSSSLSEACFPLWKDPPPPPAQCGSSQHIMNWPFRCEQRNKV